MPGDPAQQRGNTRRVPVQLHVRDGAGRVHHVERALAQYLVGDGDIAATRIAGFGHHANESGSPAEKRATTKHTDATRPLGAGRAQDLLIRRSMETVRPALRNPESQVSVLLAVRDSRHSPVPSVQSVRKL